MFQMKNQNPYSDEKFRRYHIIQEQLLRYANQENDELDDMLVRAIDEYTEMKQRSNNTYQYNWVGTSYDQPATGEMNTQFAPNEPPNTYQYNYTFDQSTDQMKPQIGPPGSSNGPLEDLIDPTINPSSFLSAQEISNFFESFEHHKENDSPGTSTPKIPPHLIPKECAVCGTNKTTKWRRGVFLEQICSPCYMYEARNGKKRPQELSVATYEKITEVIPKVPKKKNRPPPAPKQCSNCYTNKCSTWRRGRNWERLCSNCWMYDVAHPGEKRPQELIETTFRRNTGAQYPYGAPVEIPMDLRRPCLKCRRKEAKRRMMCIKCYDAERWLEKRRKRDENSNVGS